MAITDIGGLIRRWSQSMALLLVFAAAGAARGNSLCADEFMGPADPTAKIIEVNFARAHRSKPARPQPPNSKGQASTAGFSNQFGANPDPLAVFESLLRRPPSPQPVANQRISSQPAALQPTASRPPSPKQESPEQLPEQFPEQRTEAQILIDRLQSFRREVLANGLGFLTQSKLWRAYIEWKDVNASVKESLARLDPSDQERLSQELAEAQREVSESHFFEDAVELGYSLEPKGSERIRKPLPADLLLKFKEKVAIFVEQAGSIKAPLTRLSLRTQDQQFDFSFEVRELQTAAYELAMFVDKKLAPFNLRNYDMDELNPGFADVDESLRLSMLRHGLDVLEALNNPWFNSNVRNTRHALDLLANAMTRIKRHQSHGLSVVAAERDSTGPRSSR